MDTSAEKAAYFVNFQCIRKILCPIITDLIPIKIQSGEDLREKNEEINESQKLTKNISRRSFHLTLCESEWLPIDKYAGKR